MHPILRILLGIAIAGIGFHMVWKTTFYLGFIGRMEWAERKLGGGGSNLLYKLIGIAVCMIGIIVATNLWNAFLQATLGSIVPTPIN